MFSVALLTGIYSYILFGLGISGLLIKPFVAVITFIFIVRLLILSANSFVHKKRKFELLKSIRTGDKVVILIASLFILQILVNLYGALGPELAFDALWYHLTLPKLFLLHNAVYHIPGGLLYYSDMPKLTEMLYVGALSIGNEILAKFVHFLFGILTCIVLFVLAKKYTNYKVAVFAVAIFYSNLVVGWLSITAYNDLTRTFFEISALYYFLEWIHTKSWRNLAKTGILIGMAISTKLVALASIGIFFIIIIYINRRNFPIRRWFAQEWFIIFFSLIVPLPWFIFSYLQTGNPIYPLFSPIFTSVNEKVFDIHLINPITVITTFWNTFTRANDPISPLYLILFPLVLLYFPKSNSTMKIVYLYAFLASIVWYITSQVEGTRMLAPYLPVFSLICAVVIDYFIKNKKKYGSFLSGILILVLIMTASISVIYRGLANMKYIPVVLGIQSKANFLTNHLNFSFGDFYDTDNYFKEKINKDDRVLLYGFHNLYYVDFPFIDSSWVKKGDRFNYIAVQKAEIPPQYKNWQLIYTNDKTMVKLYKPPKDICKNTCIY